MVQAISSYGADQAFGVRILPGTPGCGEYFFNMQRRDPQTNFISIDAIPISYEIARRIPIGEGLDDLLGGPDRGGMFGHIEMQHLPTTVFQHDEHEQHLHGQRRHGEEIDRHQLADMVVKERLPPLRGGRGTDCRIRETVRSDIVMPSIVSSP